MPQVVVSNRLVKEASQTLYNECNSLTWLQTFKNTPTLDGSLNSGEFIQSNYPGYSPISLLGTLIAPIKVADGIYVFRSPIFTWTPTADDAQTVNGWYLNRAGQILMAGFMSFPRFVIAGSGIDFTLEVQAKDLSL